MSSIYTNQNEKYTSMFSKAEENIKQHTKITFIEDIRKCMKINSNRRSWFGLVKKPDMTFEEAFEVVVVKKTWYMFNLTPPFYFLKQRLNRLSTIKKLFDYCEPSDDIFEYVELSKEDLDFLDNWYNKEFNIPVELKLFDEFLDIKDLKDFE